MTSEKILALARMYRTRLEREGILPIRMPTRLSFKELAPFEILQHAHYLVRNLESFAADPEKYGKANRHLAAIQMCLSFSGWYTLDELRAHNRPD